MTGDRGGVFIAGTGGAGSGAQNAGVFVQGTATITTANAGALSIDGTGGGTGGATTLIIGIAVPSGANVRLQSGGAISLTGRGASGNGSFGILADGAASITAQTQLSLSGIASTANDGIRLVTAGTALTSAGGGSVTLTADRMTLTGATASTSGTLALTTQTAGRTISVGGSDSVLGLGLSIGDLAGFSAGRLEIGSASAGNVTVGLPYTPAAGTGTLALISGGSVGVNATLNAGSARISLSGTAGVRLGAALSSTATNVASTRAITIRTPGIFDNAFGAAALSTPSGSWALSLATPDGQSFGGLLSGNNAVWSNPVTSAVNPTGNRYSFAVSPRIFVDAGAVTKTYGDALATSVTLSNAPLATTVRTFGGVFTDYASGTLNGTYTRASAGLAATANAGTYNDLAVASVAGLSTNLAGYSIVAGSAGSLTVSPRAITLTPDAQTRVYGNANPASGTATATTGNLVNGDTVRDVALSTPAVTLSNVGSYDLSASGAVFSAGLASNYAITYATRTGGLSVTARPLSIGFSGFVSRPYGGGSFDASQALARITSGSIAAGDNPSTAAIVVGVPLTASVGDYNIPQVITLTRGGVSVNSNYALTLAPATLRVTPRPLTLTPVAVSRLYGDANPATGTATSNSGFGVGLVNGDTVSQVSLSTAATVTSDVGSYATTSSNAVFGSGLASNYAINYASNAAGLSITPRLLTLTPDTVSRAYGDANPATGTATGSLGGLVNGDAVASIDLTTPATVASGVGSYATTGSNAVFGNGLASNYSITYATNAAGLNITPRLLTLTPDAVSRAYGDANPATGTATGNLGGLVNGDAVASIDLTGPATVTSNVGSYATTGSNAVFGSGLDSNYAITYASNAAGLSITPRLLTLTPDTVSRSYGDANPATGTATGSLGGLVNGDAVASIALTTPATVTNNVGSYATTGSNAIFGNGLASNYTITYATNAAGLSITPRLLILTPDAVSRVYGDANPTSGTATGNLGGLVNGDTVTNVSLSTPATVASNIGSYATTGSSAVFGSGLASNYAITFATNVAGLNITPRLLTLTPDAVSRAYGDANPTTATATGNLGGLVNGDAVASIDLTTPATVTNNVGSYATTGSNAILGDGLASNYTITYASNATGLSITPRLLTLTPDVVSRAYGDTNPSTGSATGSLGGLVNGDAVASFDLTTPATVTSNVGSYATTGSNAVFGSGLASNYAITYASNATGLSITPRLLTLTPDTVSRAYGDANAATGTATGNLGGLVNGDAVASIDLTSPATVTSNVGSYATTGSSAVFGSGLASNYAITYADNAAGLNITPRLLSLTPDAVSRAYGDANPTTATATGNLGGLVNGDTVASIDLTTPATVTSNVGSYATTGSNAVFGSGLASNYAISFATNPSGITINPATLTYVADPASRFVRQSNPIFSGSVIGFKLNDTLSSATTGALAFTSPATRASAPGAYPIEESGLAAANGNYVFVQDPNNASALAVSPVERIPPTAVATGPSAAEIQSRQVASLMTNGQFLNANSAAVRSTANGLFSFVCSGIRVPGENCAETSE